MTTSETARGESALARAGRWCVDNPGHVAIWAFMAGFAMCFVAVALGVHSVKFTGAFSPVALREYAVDVTAPGGKEVGYLFAVNWSVFGVFVLPLTLFFGLRVFAHMAPALEDIAERGMVREATFARVAPAAVLEAWRRSAGLNNGLFIVVFSLCTIFMMYDWWSVVGEPLLRPEVIATLDTTANAPADGRIALAQPSYEFDWSIAALFAGVQTNTWGLLAFGFVAYLLIGCVAVAFAFGVVISALHFAVFVAQRGGGARRWRLLALPNDPDEKRNGWEAFAPFYSNLLCLGLTLLVGLWLMVLQNSYLRDPGSANVAALLFEGGRSFRELIDSDMSAREIPGAVFSWLLGIERADGSPSFAAYFANTQGGLGILLFGFVSLISLMASWWLLRSSAADGRAAARRNVEALAQETGQNVDTLRERLRKMQFWPVGWIKENELLVWMLVLFTALFAYRIVLVPLTVLLLGSIDAALKLVFRRRESA